MTQFQGSDCSAPAWRSARISTTVFALLSQQPSGKEPLTAIMDSKSSRGVLIVDEEHAILQLLHMALGDSGFAVYPAATAKDVLELCRQHRPAIVLLETELRGRSTYELLAELRVVHPKLQICLVSARLDEHLVDEWDHLSNKRCLCKPFALSQLVAILEQMLTK